MTYRSYNTGENEGVEGCSKRERVEENVEEHYKVRNEKGNKKGGSKGELGSKKGVGEDWL